MVNTTESGHGAVLTQALCSSAETHTRGRSGPAFDCAAEMRTACV